MFNKCSAYISACKTISGCMQVSPSPEQHFVLQCMRSGMSMCIFHQSGACCLSLDNTLRCVLNQIYSLFFLFPTGLFLLLLFFCLLPGESACKHIFKIPLCNLVGRSIERPLKSPLVNKVLTAPASTMVPPAPLIATHSLSMSRMEIKEIASRTRKELLGEEEKQTCVRGQQLVIGDVVFTAMYLSSLVRVTSNVP